MHCGYGGGGDGVGFAVEEGHVIVEWMIRDESEVIGLSVYQVGQSENRYESSVGPYIVFGGLLT